MKKSIILLMLMCSLLLSACSGGTMSNKNVGNKDGEFFQGKDSSGKSILGRFSHDDQADANERMDRVLRVIKIKDKDVLKGMFSKKVIAKSVNFDKNISELFDYYQGNLVTYNDWSAVGASEGIDDDGTGRDWKYLESTYDVKTSKDIYRFAIKEYIKDTVDSDNIGIWSMYVIKMEDDTDPKIAYRGDDKDTPGININIKNVLPEEDPSISPVSINE